MYILLLYDVYSHYKQLFGIHKHVYRFLAQISGLSCRVILFTASVSFKNHKIKASDWKTFSQSEGGFWSQRLEQKESHHMNGYAKREQATNAFACGCCYCQHATKAAEEAPVVSC